MLTKPLGNTSIAIPALGQAAGDYFWNSNNIDYDQKVALLRKGIELGMNLIDTAAEYGDGMSEEMVGKAIQGIKDRVVTSTKFSPQHSKSLFSSRTRQEGLFICRQESIAQQITSWVRATR